MEKRFDPLKLSDVGNIDQHFVANVKPYVHGDEYGLGLGCGAGIFLVRMTKICGKIVGAEIAKPFVEVAGAAIAKLKLNNAGVVEIDGKHLEFADAPI
jgi:tRNA/tmRNA/rRNA uracil-C5-methylase (TrmA/RlmC/RlmD family)